MYLHMYTSKTLLDNGENGHVPTNTSSNVETWGFCLKIHDYPECYGFQPRKNAHTHFPNYSCKIECTCISNTFCTAMHR